MAKKKPKVEFAPTQAKVGAAWYVRITLPNTGHALINSFKSKDEAEEWIRVDSATWLKEYENGRYA